MFKLLEAFIFYLLFCIYNQIKKSLLTRRKPLFSPLKELKISKKAKRVWSTQEDTALVQFVALDKDQQASEAEWPAITK